MPISAYPWGIVFFCFAGDLYYQRWVKQKSWNEVWSREGKYLLVAIMLIIFLFLPHRSKA